MTTQDLVPAIYAASLVELNEPVGWCIIPLTSPPDPLDDMIEDADESNVPISRRIVRTHLVQIEICSMHQNGRDTHVRQGKHNGYGTQYDSPTTRTHQCIGITLFAKNAKFNCMAQGKQWGRYRASHRMM